MEKKLNLKGAKGRNKADASIHCNADSKAHFKAPLGQPTRGKTAQNRLRRVDFFVMLYDPKLIQRTEGDYEDAMFVDVGPGCKPITTLESARRFRTLNPTMPVMGVEIDKEWVRLAQTYQNEITHFRKGGFNLPVKGKEKVRLIRAFNVLRQYEENAAAGAHAMMGSYLVEGGLLIEGTSDTFGRIWAMNLLRQTGDEGNRGLKLEGLVFSTNFKGSEPFEPGVFQSVLPKNFIHKMVPGEEVYEFFEDWKQCHQDALACKLYGPRFVFADSAHRLAAKGKYKICTHKRWLRLGFLVWYMS